MVLIAIMLTRKGIVSVGGREKKKEEIVGYVNFSSNYTDLDIFSLIEKLNGSSGDVDSKP